MVNVPATPPPGLSTLIVSPHLDDAMLSTAAYLLGTSDGPLEVVTVFAGLPADPSEPSEWDLACGFSTPAAALEARLAEDDAAFAGLGARRHHLSLADGAYGERSAPPEPEIQEWVRRWVAEHGGPVRVLVPVGAGVPPPSRASAPEPGSSSSRRPWWRTVASLVVGRPGRAVAHRMFLRRKRQAQAQGMLAHHDHLLVRDAVLAELVGHEDCDLLCYEELPYLWSRSGDEAAASLAVRHGVEATCETRPVDTAAKAERLAAYRSQVAPLDPGGRLLDPGALPASERCWRLTPRP